MLINCSKQYQKTLLYSAIILLTACGGGGSSSSSGGDTNNNSPTPGTPSTQCTALQYLENNQCKDKLSQSIDLPNIPTTVRAGESFTLATLNSTAGLPLQFQSLSTSICSVNSTGKVQALKQGECSLTLSQSGNHKYRAAAEVNVKFNIAVGTNNQGDDAIAADIANCQAGKLSAQHKTAALNTLNQIRALHNLNSVVYDDSSENEAMQASLVIAANDHITHNPAAHAKCYTETALNGSQKSNLDYFYSTAPLEIDLNKALVNMMTEQHSDTIGHRRWLLNPFLNKVAFGAVLNTQGTGQYQYSSASAIKVIYDFDQASTSDTGIVAYPFGNYPAKYFAKNVPLSFSIFRDKNDFWKNKQVDLTTATIKVVDRQSTTVQSITNVAFDNDHAGLANSLQFDFKALQYGRVYDVQVNNVKIDGIITNYNYWFKVVE